MLILAGNLLLSKCFISCASRLKIGNDIQYVLNPKGTTPAEIMGFDYKVMLKPVLESYADDIKRSSVVKLEELVSLQKKSAENAARLEGKRNQLAALQSRIDQVSVFCLS